MVVRLIEEVDFVPNRGFVYSAIPAVEFCEETGVYPENRKIFVLIEGNGQIDSLDQSVVPVNEFVGDHYIHGRSG